MNKKQFATKLMASLLSASFLVPCATTFAIKSKANSSEPGTLAGKSSEVQKKKGTQKTKQKDNKNKSILENPCVKAAEYGAGAATLFFGGKFLLKHIFSDGNSQGNTNGGAAPVAPHVDPVVPVASPVVPVPRPAAPPAPAPAPAPEAEENRTGWNELHHAAESVQNAAVLYNLEPAQKKACFEARDALGRTPLYIAFKYRNQFFLEHFHNEYNFEQLYRQSSQEMYDFFIFDVFCTAARFNDVTTLRYLCQHFPNHDVYLYRTATKDRRDYSLLDIALQHGSLHAMAYLTQRGVQFNMGNVFNSAALTPENKLEFLNVWAAHRRAFADPADRNSFINCIFRDQSLSDDNRLAILRSLRAHGHDFGINNIGSPMSHARANLTISIIDLSNPRTALFKFYIEDCNALSYMNNAERAEIVSAINRIQNADVKQELLAYFNQKCAEQPDAPNAQPTAVASPTGTAPNTQPAAGASPTGTAPSAQPTAGAPQQSTPPAQPQLTQAEVRARRIAALNRRV